MQLIGRRIGGYPEIQRRSTKQGNIQSTGNMHNYTYINVSQMYLYIYIHYINVYKYHTHIYIYNIHTLKDPHIVYQLAISAGWHAGNPLLVVRLVGSEKEIVC